MLMLAVSLVFIMACEGEIDPCQSETDLDFIKLKGEVRYDERFGRNIIFGIHTPPPVKIDGTDHYVPCNLSAELVPGSKITFTGKGERIKPDFDTLVGGDAFYSILLSEVELSPEDH